MAADPATEQEPIVAEGPKVSFTGPEIEPEREERPFFYVPARRNAKLQLLLDAINADESLHQLWRCANINAVDRSGMSDHGPTHIRIVCNIALKLLRLLVDGGCEPNI